jgi:predicted TPR repeat methyltransferase
MGKGDRLLEFGSGTGLVGFNLLESVGSLTFIDESAGMRKVLAEKIALHPQGGKCETGDSLFSTELRPAVLTSSTHPWSFTT